MLAPEILSYSQSDLPTPFDVIVAGELIEHVENLSMLFDVAAEALAFARLDPLFEFSGFARQLVVAERLDIVGKRVDLLDDLAHTLELPVIAGTEKFLQAVGNHRISLFHIGVFRRGVRHDG